MYDNGHGPLVNAGYVSAAGVGTAVGVMHQVLLTVTIVFTSFLLYRLVARGVRRNNRSTR
ncbi:hypothetical protein ACMYYO_11950 [Dermacoccaceae bacterium W4C1]